MPWGSPLAIAESVSRKSYPLYGSPEPDQIRCQVGPRFLFIFFLYGPARYNKYGLKMETTKQTKEVYLKPEFDTFEIKFEGCLCQSPGGGGSEGTGNEPLFP